MSQIKVKGNASGTGVFTIESPATNTDRTLTLPDAAGTIATQYGTGVGKVLQVVHATYSTISQSSSSTFADTGLTATITPTSASSKILVTVVHNGCGKETNNTYLFLRLLRDSTTISNIERIGGATNSTASNYFGSCGITYLDSPATTSAVTYKTQFASQGNNAIINLQTSSGGTNSMSTITLMEIAA